MQTASVQTMSAARSAHFESPRAIEASVIHLPWAMTYDQDVIDAGRFRAGQMYSAARTDRERLRALRFWNHWRWLNTHANAMRKLQLLLRS